MVANPSPNVQVLRHFVNSLDALLEDKKPTIVSSLCTLVGESDLNLKKAMMQLIVSMTNMVNRSTARIAQLVRASP